MVMFTSVKLGSFECVEWRCWCRQFFELHCWQQQQQQSNFTEKSVLDLTVDSDEIKGDVFIAETAEVKAAEAVKVKTAEIFVTAFCV